MSGFAFDITGRGGSDPEKEIRKAERQLNLAVKKVPNVVRKELRKALELAIADVIRRRPLKGNQIYEGLRVEDIPAGSNDIAMAIRGNRLLAVHEFGATIFAKRAQFLTIPLDAALKGGRKIHRSSRDWKNTFVFRSKAGNLLIAQKKGRRVVPLYVLKRSVRIPARLGMRQSIADQMPRALTRILDSMDKELNNG